MAEDGQNGTPRIPVALQLYTVRDDFQRDPKGTLQAVAAMGYTALELLSSFGGMSAAQFREQLDAVGLRAVSGHPPLSDLRTRLDGVIEDALTLGCTYVACPWLPEEERTDAAGYRRLAKELTGFAERCRAQGLGFAYHNHNFEFEQFDGQYALDILFGTAGGEVQSELDVYWAAYAGVDPAAYIRKLGARCAIVHLKDMTRDESRTFAEIGAGQLDFAPIFAASRDAGVKFYVVEQDRCQRPPLESARISLEQLRAWGIA